MINYEKTKHQLKGEIKNITCRDGYCRITIEAPAICHVATPGQFVMVKASEEKSNDPLFRRPFSIHQVADGWLTIIFKIVGRGTKKLAKMKAAEMLDVIGPLGKGFHIANGQRHYLVGGGVGIAPLHFLAESIYRYNPESEIVALLGARTAKELDAFAHINSLNFMQVAISTDDGTAGHHGLVIDLLERSVTEKGLGPVYCCGPWPMMKAIAMYCSNKKMACQVSLETIMACGVGACLGCAVSGSEVIGDGYLHVCKDGPVFEAEKIWL
ncbi:MAG: dihydroorotate dehydrogenase electron transfer subunit [Proteobacteria bacterium]|nr:dihydroorotate dehydrogenase electron transfer subunit [Pseudomonadota bacterium]MBU4297898.1 dihydroorotate dehydrogenase electron transfer subunit [Pseudomonadota bacterium]MCG2746018.1 dihydroorotate dehydrogenase electron transfer subunit [Desulfobulbaceae bacterium]